MAFTKLISALGNIADSGKQLSINTAKLGQMLSASDEAQQQLLRQTLDDLQFSTKTIGDKTIFSRSADVLNEEADLASTQLKSTLDDLLVDMSGVSSGSVPNPASNLGRSINDSSTISGVTLPQRMLDDMRVTQSTRQILNTRLAGNTFSPLPTNINWKDKTVGGAIKQTLMAPREAFKDLARDIVLQPTLNKLQEDRFAKTFAKVYDEILTPLSKIELEDYNKILRQGDDLEEVFKPGKGGLIDSKGNLLTGNAKVIDSYYATRELLDHAYWMNNNTAIRQARRGGFKLFKGQEIAKPSSAKLGTQLDNNITWNKKLKDADWQIFEIKGNDGKLRKVAFSQDKQKEVFSEIPDTYRMIAYRKGYVSKIYEDQWAVTKIVKNADGTFSVSRVATAPTRVRSEKAVEKLRAGEPTAEFISHRKNEDAIDFTFHDEFLPFLDRLSQPEIDSLRKSLVNLGFDVDDVNKLKGMSKFFSHKQNAFMKKRAAKLVDSTLENDAPTLPSDEAIARYFQSTSRYSAHAEWNATLEREFLSEYGDLLTNKADWKSAINFSKKSVNGRRSSEAFHVQAQLKRVVGVNSAVDEIIDNWTLGAFDRFAQTNAGKLVNETIDRFIPNWAFTPTITRLAASSKGLAAKTKLGLWNVSQIVVQGTAMLNVIGYSGLNAFKAGQDILQAFGPSVIKVGRSAEGRKLFKAIEDSGFIAGLDYVGLQNVTAGRRALAGSRHLKKLVDSHMIPYTMGEGSVRGLAWFAERRNLIEEIEKGVNKVFTKGDVDNPAFLAAVSERAIQPALNMSRMNQPLIARGLIGVPFQFQQFALQQLTFMFGKKMNAVQRARVFGAWTGAFGIQGVPLLFDAVEGAENFAADALDDPNAIGFFRDMGSQLIGELTESVTGEGAPPELLAMLQRWASAGPLAAMTEGDLILANRAGLASYISDLFNHGDADDIVLGPGYQVAKTLLANNINNVTDMIRLLRTDESISKEYLFEAGKKAVDGLTQPANLVKALEGVTTNEIRDTKGRLLIEQPSFAEMMYLGFGLGVGERTERFSRIELIKRREEKAREIFKEFSSEIGELSLNHPDHAQTLFAERTKQIAEFNPRLVRKFSRDVAFERLTRTLPEHQREMMRNILRYNTHLNAFEVKTLQLVD